LGNKGWHYQRGTISGQGDFGSLDIISDKQLQRFELSFDFNVSPGGNSGVKYFVTLDLSQYSTWAGIPVLDDSLHPDAKAGRDGNRTMASVYDLIKG